MDAFLDRFSFDAFGPAPVREDLWDAIVIDVVTAAKIQSEADKVLVDVQEWVSEEYKDPEADYWKSFVERNQDTFVQLRKARSPYTAPMAVWLGRPLQPLSLDLPDLSDAVKGTIVPLVTQMALQRLNVTDFKQNKSKPDRGELGDVAAHADLPDDPEEMAARRLEETDQAVNMIGSAREAAKRRATEHQRETMAHYDLTLRRALPIKTVRDAATGVTGKIDVDNSFVAEKDLRLADGDTEKKRMHMENQRLGYRFGVLAAPGLKKGTCGTELHVYVPSADGLARIDPVLTGAVKGHWIAHGEDGAPTQMPSKVVDVALSAKGSSAAINVDVCALPVEPKIK